ncbi:MAG: TRAM domain-containing protein, partial [Bacteroidota bacterium]
ALRTTLICGYPGETEQDFEEMLAWVSEKRFDRLGVFTYSHEENTHAYLSEDDVPDEVKKERASRIMEAQSEISLQHNQSRIGHEYRVLADRVEGDTWVGRTEYDSPEVDNEVIITAPDGYLRIGDFVQVRIEDADHYDLHGVVIP